MALDRLTKVDGGGISTTSDYRVGIITASKFVGPFDGTGGNFSGVVTATDGVFSGNVTIGGTLTYEDVSNIDSVGIITARKNILVGGANEIVGTPYNYFYGRGSGASGVSVYAAEASLELVGSNAGSHVSSLLFRTAGNDGIGFNYNAGGNVLELKSFDATGNNFQIHASGSNVSNLKNILKAVSGGAIELYHNNTKRLETTSTGIKAYGNDHLFTTESTGDCRIILQSDSDNNAENDNSAVVFRQDGSADIGAIGVNLTNSTSIPPSQELFVASSSGESAIILATGFSNGYNNAVERVRINNAGITTFTQNVFLNKDLDVDGHTNLDNVSVAGVTTFTDDVYFDGATAGRDITFDRSENKVHFKHNARAEFGQGSYNTQFKSDGVNFTLVHNPITAFYLYSNTFNVIGAGNRSGNTYDSSLLSIHNGVVKLGFELPNGGASSLDNIITTEKGITVGTGVTIERNGQATFSGITTGTIFKVPDATNAGGATNHIAIGDNSDLKLFHDSNGDAQIFNGTGHLTIVNNTSGKVINLQPKSGANGVIARYEGAVELYHNGEKRIETASSGVLLPDMSTNKGRLAFGDFGTRIEGGAGAGADDGIHFMTNSVARWQMNPDGDLIPNTAGAVDIGSTSAEIGNVYIADNKRFYAGSDQNLSLHHNSSTGINYLVSNPGNMFYMSATNYFTDAAQSKIQAQFIHNSYCELRHAGNLKFRTSETGIDVTGEVKATQDYPNFSPLLDFNFAATKKLDPRITFQRTGLASFTDEFGLVKIVADNAPRFDHDPITRECKGLLIEESRTNFLKYSVDFASIAGYDANYSAARSTLTSTTEVAPDGTNTASKYVRTSGQGTGEVAIIIGNTLGLSNGTVYTSSVFVKNVGNSSTVEMVNTRASDVNDDSQFNLANGTIITEGSNNSLTTITPYPNDWYRISVTATHNNLSGYFWVRIYNQTEGSGFILWGGQVEAGRFPTSYIPTHENASVSRGADSVKVEDEEFAEFYNDATEHTTVMVGKRLGDTVTDGRLYTISDGTTNNVAPDWDFNDDTKLRLSTNVGGSNQMLQELNPWNERNDEFKIAAGMAVNNQIGVVNGTAIAAADTNCAMPTGVDRLHFGLRGNGGNQGSLTIKRFMFYPKRLPDSQLVTLTS